MSNRAYDELNLKRGATEIEIRAAFRRLAKESHPDTSAEGQQGADKFRRAYGAYRELMARMGAKRPRNVAPPDAPESPTAFVFDGQRKAGLDVYVDLALVRPDAADFRLVLPWTAHEACPRCLGRGQTLGRLGPDSSLYRPQPCPRCQGRGSLESPSHLSVTVTAEMAQRGRFRLRGAGGYLPSQARRGDLIVSLRFVDGLPKGH
ncbi:MAG: DnaJ domain-containing protein [Deltaproteobacteria bacterium]|jgi:DnaJ-class molecular chaperone|nr:DnaJ domain-containing protein [Deltaproteobacteria bacterium]